MFYFEIENNKVGGDYLNKDIYYYWKIGKLIYSLEESCMNVHQRFSEYFSYYYGNSNIYTRENLYLMKRFYINFPIFYETLNLLSWNQYCLLFQIKNKQEMYFYFRLSLYFHSDLDETSQFIHNRYFLRI